MKGWKVHKKNDRKIKLNKVSLIYALSNPSSCVHKKFKMRKYFSAVKVFYTNPVTKNRNY
jgi:hypothetical protein